MLLNGSASALIVIAMLVLALIALARRESGRADRLGRVRGRLLMTVATVVALLVGIVALDRSLPSLDGLPFVVGPAVAATGAVLVFGVAPWRLDDIPGRRTADIRRRSGLQLLRGWTLLIPAVPLVLLVGLVVTCGTIADADGRSVTIVRPQVEANSGFPGWFSGLPILVAVGVLLVATAIALHRTAMLPAVYADARHDLRWRRRAGATIIAVTGIALFLELAWVAWSASGALRGLSEAIVVGRVPDADPVLATVAAVLGAGAQLSGLIAATLFVTAVVRAVSLGRRAAAVPG